MPDWRMAYLEQAASDYEALQTLAQAGAPLCQQLHYLQMATEKLAKGFLTPPGGARYGNTHDAFVRFLRSAKNRPEFRRAGRFTNRGQYEAYVDSLLSKAQQVEDLSPEGGDHANPEYPWEIRGTVYSPLTHSFPGLDLINPQMQRLLRFVEDCLALRSE